MITTGQRFGRLVAVERVGSDGHVSIWNCRCDCGTEKHIRSSSLLSNDGTKSCGCLKASKLQKETITCKVCKKELPRNDFYKKWKHHDTRHNICKYCMRIVLCDKKKKCEQQLRLAALVHYGGSPPKCACCGELHIEFLTIDHINGDGAEHRRKMGSNSSRIGRWLKKMNYPDGFRVLCYNCNCSIGAYGYCPHSKEHNEHTTCNLTTPQSI